MIVRLWRRLGRLFGALRENPTSEEVARAFETEEPPQGSKEAAKRAMEKLAGEQEGDAKTQPS